VIEALPLLVTVKEAEIEFSEILVIEHEQLGVVILLSNVQV
jgi:hypothetical protein